MQSRAKQEAWIKAALEDGWEKSTDPKDSGYIKQNKATYLTLLKDNFRVTAFFHKKASLCSLYIYSPNGNRHETVNSGQMNGYNWSAILELVNTCPHCQKKEQDLKESSRFTFFCQDCIDSIKEFSKNNPLSKPREYIGEAEVIFRNVRGRVSSDKVKEYRVLARINGKITAYWEPYNGTNKNEAVITYQTVQVTLSVAGYKVTTKEIETTWNGEEI